LGKKVRCLPEIWRLDEVENDSQEQSNASEKEQRSREKNKKKKEREREKTTVLTYFRWVFFEFFSLPLENLVTVAPNNCYAKS
jgi:hypothetical protein